MSALFVGALVGVMLAGALILNPKRTSMGSEISPTAPASAAAASASGEAAPTASASASAAPIGGSAMPPFDSEPFPAEKSPRPTPAEWKPTLPVSLTEKLPFDCHAYRVREWVKIRCSKLQTAEVAMLGGDSKEVLVFVDPTTPSTFVPGGGEIVFPVRPGDRRVFEWSTFGDSYEGVGFPEVAFLISESWAPGDPAPTIIPH